MRLIRKEDVQSPFLAPLGEQIFEMIGCPPQLGGTTNHSVAHVVIPPHKQSPRHYHKLSEETYYVLAGAGDMEIDDKRFGVRPGDAILIMPHEWHQIANNSAEDIQFLAISAPAWVPTDTYLE